MENKKISQLIFYGILIIVLVWGILGSLYLAFKELVGVIGHLVNWEWGAQFFDASKGVGLHIFAGVFLLLLAVFLAWMGRTFLTWISQESRRRRARDYKRRNYR